MGSSARIRPVSDLQFGRSRQCLAFPLFGGEEWWRCLPDSLLHSLFPHRCTSLLHGIGPWSIHESWASERIRHGTRLARFLDHTSPLMKQKMRVFSLGVGFAMIINSILGTLYYNVLIAWALFYFILSFRKRLLWADCGHWWNTDRCFVPGSQTDYVSVNGSTLNCTQEQNADPSVYTCEPMNATERITATEEFF